MKLFFVFILGTIPYILHPSLSLLSPCISSLSFFFFGQTSLSFTKVALTTVNISEEHFKNQLLMQDVFNYGVLMGLFVKSPTEN